MSCKLRKKIPPTLVTQGFASFEICQYFEISVTCRPFPLEALRLRSEKKMKHHEILAFVYANCDEDTLGHTNIFACCGKSADEAFQFSRSIKPTVFFPINISPSEYDYCSTMGSLPDEIGWKGRYEKACQDAEYCYLSLHKAIPDIKVCFPNDSRARDQLLKNLIKDYTPQ